MEQFQNWMEAAVVVLVISAAVRALPDPNPKPIDFKGKLYLWMYNFTHIILANLDKIVKNKNNSGTDKPADKTGV